MPRGRQSRTLTKWQIARLEEFRRARHEGAPHGYSLPQLRMAMDAGFGWRTLQKALLGLPVWDLHHAFIVQWIKRYLPAPPELPRDGKAAAAGEFSEAEPPEHQDAEPEEIAPPRAAKTVRGSR